MPLLVFVLLYVVLIIIGRFATRIASEADVLIASRVEEACPANGKARIRPLVLGSRIAWVLTFACLIPVIWLETSDLLTGKRKGADGLGDALEFALCLVAFLCLGVIASLSTLVDAWLRTRAARSKL